MENSQIAELIRLAKKGRRAEARSKAIGKLIGGLVYTVLAALIAGFYLMLLLGIAHNDWHPAIPAPGYWLCVIVFALARAIYLGMRPMKDVDS